MSPARGLRTALSLEALDSRIQPAVTYHGGALMPHVEAQAVYLGSAWGSAPGQARARQLDGFLSYLVASPYMDSLTNAGYRVGRGTASSGVIAPRTLDPGYYLTDSQIQHTLQAEISAGAVRPPDANRLYVVYVEPGIAVAADGADSINGFLGYHGAFAGRDAAGRPADIRYVVAPYPGGWNPTAAAQGLPSNLAELTAVTSHELAESATDPDVNYKQLGWYDDRYNSEIGDLTEGDFRVSGGYYVQRLITRNDRILGVPGSTAPAAGTWNGLGAITGQSG